MPVFYFCRNIDTISRFHFYCFFSFFLIVSTSCNADKDLSASAFCMMNMPVIPALNWTTPSQSPGFTGLNTIQNCVFCTLFDEVLLLSTIFLAYNQYTALSFLHNYAPDNPGFPVVTLHDHKDWLLPYVDNHAT